MNHPDAMQELARLKFNESYANSMLSYAFNNGLVCKLGVTVEYSGPFGYSFQGLGV